MKKKMYSLFELEQIQKTFQFEQYIFKNAGIMANAQFSDSLFIKFLEDNPNFKTAKGHYNVPWLSSEAKWIKHKEEEKRRRNE